MKTQGDIDFARLLGFEALRDEISGVLDLRHLVMDAKLGAKVGAEAWVECDVNSEFPSQTKSSSS